MAAIKDYSFIQKKVSKRGLYLYARDFWNYEDVNILMTKKQEIVKNYIDKMVPQLFNARAAASYNNQVGINEIDDFFTGGNDKNSGFIKNVQKEVNQYYSESLREAESLFTSHTNLNAILGDGVDNSRIYQLTDAQIDELIRMMAAQEAVLDAMSNLASLYEHYVIQRCIDAGYKPPRNINSGLYNLNNAKISKAFRDYEIIKQQLAILKSESSSGLHSFTFFKDTAHKFHNVYSELLLTVCSYNVLKARKILFSQVEHTGNDKYIIGKGDLTVDIKHHLDPEYQKIINSATPILTNRKITVTNDTTLTAGINGVAGTWGGNVKEYSDETLRKLEGFTVVASSAGTLFFAAQRATQYGLPSVMASEIWIKNLAGAVTKTSSEEALAQEYWSNYKEWIAQLLILDALMGGFANNNISSKANNLIFFTEGHAYYIGDLIKNMTEDDIHGFTGRPFGSKWSQDAPRRYASAWHWENYIQKGSSTQAEELIASYVNRLQLKISFNLNNVLLRMIH